MSGHLVNCRICRGVDLPVVIDLGNQVITSRFPLLGDFSTPKIPISLSMCQSCGLLQLTQTTSPDEMYEHEYGYRSGINATMRNHLKAYKEEICSMVELVPGDCVVDIGSNDSTMLQYYDPTLTRVGIDPTGKQFQEYYGNVELLPTYFTKSTFQTVYGSRKCKIVSSISMFYDLPDPVEFANDIYSILDDEGIWTCEQSYLPSMIQTNSIDTICHEHLEYYSLKQIKYIADKANFKIINVFFNTCNGGSFRVYFAKKDSVRKEADITAMLENETEYTNRDAYVQFIESVGVQIQKLKEYIAGLKAAGKEIWIYGASTKGNCLLQYANLTSDDLRYAVERNPNKVGKMTSTGIEIISEETMRASPPAALLVLPWHFKEEIVARESEFLKGGGQIVFPFPTFSVVSG